jgi:hypothetical protein
LATPIDHNGLSRWRAQNRRGRMMGKANQRKSKGRAKSSLRSLTRATLVGDDVNKFWAEVVGDNDRACALVCFSLVDQSLIVALQTLMKELTQKESDDLFFEEKSLFGTMSHRVEANYAFNIINSYEKKCLHSIRKIRNVFAHALIPVTFANPLISKECRNLPPIRYADPPEFVALNPDRRRFCEGCLSFSNRMEMVGKNHPRYNIIRAMVNDQYSEPA